MNIKEADIKHPIKHDEEEAEQPYTWAKFLLQVFWIFVMLFVMVKIVQAYAT